MNVQRGSISLANFKLGFARRFTVNVSYRQKKQNHYDSLGITPKATQGDIKTAYYKLSKECHPDLNKGDESAAEKFRNITTAYEVLGNVKSRKIYDRILLVGTYDHEFESDTNPVVDNYQHAPFYHHRNKPTNRKTESSTKKYNIDEWTQAHYSKTFEKSYKFKTDSHTYKARIDDNEKDFGRIMSILSLVFLVAISFTVTRTDVRQKFDSPSKINDKPD